MRKYFRVDVGNTIKRQPVALVRLSRCRAYMTERQLERALACVGKNEAAGLINMETAAMQRYRYHAALKQLKGRRNATSG
jgi:hypothetical protein